MSIALANTPTDLKRLFTAHGKVRNLKKRDKIDSRSDDKLLFMVIKGCMQVSISNPERDGKLCISHLQPGDIFGEQILFETTPSQLTTLTTRARSDVELTYVTREEVIRAAKTYPGIYAELSSMINRRLSQTTEKLMQFIYEDLDQRCFKSLVALTRLPDAMTHPNGMLIKLTRIDLAQMTGCTRESAGRALKAMRDRGQIDFKGQQIVVYGIRYGVPINPSPNAAA
jgi:CRP/FNR family cyclic AMP-dependent transcriptional regulator